MSLYESVPRRPVPQLFVCQRVKGPHELRIGFEKTGCPGCNQDVWVRPAQISGRAEIMCRQCARG